MAWEGPDLAPAISVFEQEFFIECRNCRTMMRIQRPGRHYCPECKVKFEVHADRSYRF